MLVDVNLRIRAVRGVSLLLKTQHADAKFKSLDINIKLFWYSNTKVKCNYGVHKFKPSCKKSFTFPCVL